MATATENSGAHRQAPRRAAVGAEPVAAACLVFEDTDGGSRFTIRGAHGETLAQLGRYATAAREDSDAERWLDDGGSLRGETVTQ